MPDPSAPHDLNYTAPVKKRWAAIIVPLLFATAGGLVAIYGNVHFIKTPDTLMDWTVQLCGGLTFAIIIYFIVWGHFQD